MNRILAVSLSFVLLAGAAAWGAPAAVPEAGLQAEMAGRWELAARIYRERLAEDPQQAELWSRLADIQIRLGRSREATLALLKAAELQPERDELFFRLSQLHAVNRQPEAALAAVERAVELAPANLDYLRARAQLANWAGRTAVARDSYEAILKQRPDDPEARLGLARTLAWSGGLDRAAGAYRDYLQDHPEDREAWLDAARVESWRGNYPAALDLLDGYRDRFGPDSASRGQRARVLAWAGRPRAALEIVVPLLAEEPDDYPLLFTRAVALHQGRRPAAALADLERLEELRPVAKETSDLGRVIRRPLHSRLAPGFYYYVDSDDIRILRGEFEADLALTEDTRLGGTLLAEKLRADAGSGLEAADGDETVEDRRFWLGASHRFSPEVSIEARAGGGNVDSDRRFWRGRLLFDWQPADSLQLLLSGERDLYAISPRAVSLEVKRNAAHLRLLWRPDLRWTVDLELDHSWFSDDNRRWEAALAPRRAVLRTEDFNLDLGLSTWWFGFEKDLAHGYYDPSTYRRHALNAYGYWKLSDDAGLSLQLGAGIQKDESMDHYTFGADVVAEALFGIFSDWQLRLVGARTDRDQEGGSFDGTSARAELTYRF